MQTEKHKQLGTTSAVKGRIWVVKIPGRETNQKFGRA